MNPAHVRIIASASPDGRVGCMIPPLTRAAMFRRGLLTERAGAYVVTDAARARLVSFQKKSAAHRKAAAPSIVVEGEAVDIRMPCAHCGAQLGSHRNRVPHPYPEKDCNAFRRRPG